MKKLYLVTLLILQLALATKTNAQNVAINATGSLPDNSAMLDITSTDKGFLAPRLTTTQQNAIALPATGLLIFNTTDNVFKVNTGTPAIPLWTPLATGSGLSGTGYPKFAGSVPTYTTAIPNADLANSAITIQGTPVSLGGTVNIINGTGFVKATGTTISYDNNTYLTSATGRTNISLTTTGTSGAATYNNATGVLNIPAYAAGTGTVTSASVASANGFSGTVATATTTPAITLGTTITGILKGNGTAISAAIASDFPVLNQNTTGNAATVTNGVYTTTFNTLGDARYSLLTHNHSLDGLSNITITSKATGDLLKWNGTAWVNFAPNYISSYTETDPIVKAINGIVKSNGTTIAAAVAADFPTLNQNTTGNAATVTTNANLTGPITSVGNATTISANAVTYAKMQAVTANRLLGSGLSGTTVSEITLGTGLSFTGSTLNAATTGGTVTNVAALTLGTSGTDLSSSVATGSTTPVITLNVPNASASSRGVLSIADWTTFNGKLSPTGNGSGLTGITESQVTNLVSDLAAKQNALGFTPYNATNPAGYISSSSIAGATDATITTPANNQLLQYNSGTGKWVNTTPSFLSSYTETDPVVKAINGMVKSNGTTISAAVAGTDYTTPSSIETVTNKNLTSVTNTFPTFNQNTTGTAANVTGIVAVPNGGTGLNSVTTGDLLYGSAANTYSKLPAGTNGQVLTLTSGIPSWATSPSSNAWNLTGNTVTAGSHFLGSTNNVSLRFRTNNVERMVMDSIGRFGIGTNTLTEALNVNGNLALSTSTAKVMGNSGNLTFEQNGDVYGTTRLSIQNRNAVNGAMFEQAGTVDLVDFVFKGLTNQRNIRYENRAAFSYTGYPNPEFQIGIAGDPTFVVSDNSSVFRRGTVGVGILAPTALLHLGAGTATAGTAPLKFAAGTNLSSPENGAVEFNGTHFYGTVGSTRYQLDQQAFASFTGSLSGDVTGIQSVTVVGKINGISLAGLGTGILKNTTGTGVPSIAVAADFPTLNQNTTGTASNVTGTVAVVNGGTGLTSVTTGDLLYGSASNTYGKIPAGNNGQVLTLTSGIPAWTNTAASNAWNLAGNTVTSGSQFLGSTNNVSLRFRTNNVERMVVDSTGMVGLGTATPTQILHVAGESAGTGIGPLLIKSNTGQGSVGTSLTIDNTAAVGGYRYSIISTGPTAGGGAGQLGIYGGAGPAYVFRLNTNGQSISGLNTVNYLGQFTAYPYNATTPGIVVQGFTSQSANLQEWRNSSSVILAEFSASGKLGISKTTPTSLLHLGAGTATANTAPLKFTTGTNLTTPEDGAVEYDGSHFYGTVGSSRYQLDQQVTGTAWSLTGNAATAGSHFLGSTNNVSLRFRTNNVENMVIDSTGKVGIGTNAPAADLTIFQSAGFTPAKGVRFTGNSVGGTSSGTGFGMTLGYNITNNKQLWLGDADYLGNSAATFFRYSSSSGYTIIDAVSGDNSVRRSIALGVGSDPSSSIILGSDLNVATPSSYVWANGNMAIGNGYRANSAPTNGLLVQGNVGIGTSAPNSPLQINGSLATAVTSVSASTTLSATNSLVLVTTGSGSNKTITLPAASGCAGRVYTIKKVDAGNKSAIVDGNGGETIDGAINYTLLNSQWKYLTVQSDGSNWLIISNN